MTALLAAPAADDAEEGTEPAEAPYRVIAMPYTGEDADSDALSPSAVTAYYRSAPQVRIKCSIIDCPTTFESLGQMSGHWRSADHNRDRARYFPEIPFYDPPEPEPEAEVAVVEVEVVDDALAEARQRIAELEATVASLATAAVAGAQRIVDVCDSFTTWAALYQSDICAAFGRYVP